MQKQKKNPNKHPSSDVEVLYQKMGNRWFAYSIVDGEVFMGSISQEEIDALEAGEKKATFEVKGNS